VKVGKECIETNYISLEGAPGFLFSGDPLNKTPQFMWVSQHSRADSVSKRIVFFKPIQLGCYQGVQLLRSRDGAPGRADPGSQDRQACSQPVLFSFISGVAIRMNAGELNGCCPTDHTHQLPRVPLRYTRVLEAISVQEPEWPLKCKSVVKKLNFVPVGRMRRNAVTDSDCCRIGATNTTSDSTDWSCSIEIQRPC
jgi:hypothetical protein